MVATPVGGVPEVVVDRRTGLLVPPDQPQALAASLKELQCDPALRRRLSEAGIDCVRVKYHQTAVIAQLEALYQDLARAMDGRGALLT